MKTTDGGKRCWLALQAAGQKQTHRNVNLTITATSHILSWGIPATREDMCSSTTGEIQLRASMYSLSETLWTDTHTHKSQKLLNVSLVKLQWVHLSTLADSTLCTVSHVTPCPLYPSPVSQLLLVDAGEPQHLCALLYSVCKRQRPWRLSKERSSQKDL